tara:strand:- start:7189 stop:7671 length:483 start_codon:yes stop_codon:yes gene_type:complete
MIIKTTKENYYASIINFFNSYYGFTNLEIKILGAFLYHYKRAFPAEDSICWKYAFSTETRKEIREYLNMDSNTFNTTLHKLKTKDISGINAAAIYTDNNILKINSNFIYPENLELKVKFDASETTKANKPNSQGEPNITKGSGENLEESVPLLEEIPKGE